MSIVVEKEKEIKRKKRKITNLHLKVTIKFRKIKGISEAKIFNKKMKKPLNAKMIKMKFLIIRNWVFFKS